MDHATMTRLLEKKITERIAYLEELQKCGRYYETRQDEIDYLRLLLAKVEQ